MKKTKVSKLKDGQLFTISPRKRATVYKLDRLDRQQKEAICTSQSSNLTFRFPWLAEVMVS